jgi:hypothetical protein
MDNDKQEFEEWLELNHLRPERKQKAVWLAIWKASRVTMRVAPKPLWKRIYDHIFGEG